MAQLGGLEGLIKDLQAEGSAMLCATGRFIGSPICSLLENLGGGNQDPYPYGSSPLLRAHTSPAGKICTVWQWPFLWMAWRAEFLRLVQIPVFKKQPILLI